MILQAVGLEYLRSCFSRFEGTRAKNNQIFRTLCIVHLLTSCWHKTFFEYTQSLNKLKFLKNTQNVFRIFWRIPLSSVFMTKFQQEQKIKKGRWWIKVMVNYLGPIFATFQIFRSKVCQISRRLRSSSRIPAGIRTGILLKKSSRLCLKLHTYTIYKSIKIPTYS